jgi:hypothetical protein
MQISARHARRVARRVARRDGGVDGEVMGGQVLRSMHVHYDSNAHMVIFTSQGKLLVH